MSHAQHQMKEVRGSEPVDNPEEGRAKIWEMIKDIRMCLLVTRGKDGGMHARPMAAKQPELAKDEAWDGRLWFFTRADSPKVEELQHNAQVLLNFAEPKHQNWVTLNGTAHLVRDPAKIKELWNEGLRLWFPKGAEDPNIVLIHVHTESGEFWDGETNPFAYAFGYAKARLTGEGQAMGESGKVGFRG